MNWQILREDTCLKFIVSIFIDTSRKKRKKNDQLCRKGKGDKNVYNVLVLIHVPQML